MDQESPPFPVVVFTGGAVIEHDCAAFISRLETHPGIELAGVFCETRSPGHAGVLRDLWQRRRWLTPLLVAQRILRSAGRMALSPGESLRRHSALRQLGDRLHVVTDLHEESVLEQVRALRPQLGAVYGGPILKPKLFTIPRLGSIGIHHGMLPRYRGKKTTFWAMHNGEEVVGVAIQRIGSGLDRGDVLCDATLTTGRLPLPVVTRRLERIGLELFVEGVLRLRRGTATWTPQPPGDFPLCRDPRAGDIVRYWLRYPATLFGRKPRRGQS